MISEGNPLLDKTKDMARSHDAESSMSINGVVNKTAFLLLVLCGAFAYTWTQVAMGENYMPWSIGGAIAGFILALIIIFSRSCSPFLITPYAICEGLFLGALSAYFEEMYPGIVREAVLLTITCFGAILALYKFKVIRYSPGFAKFLYVSIFGIMIAYLVSFVGSFFGFPLSFLHDSSPLSIGISLFVVTIATLSFIIDFEAIKNGIESRIERKYEWYFSFGLLVSLVWLYLEILRLLAKLRGRD